MPIWPKLIDPNELVSVWITKRIKTDYAVAIQVLIENRLERFQCIAIPRYRADQITGVVAVAVGGPHRVLVSASILPGNVVATCRLHRPDRRPTAKLTDRNVGAGIFQRRTRPAAAIKIKIYVCNLGQAGRSKRAGVGLDHRRGEADQSHRHSGLD